MHTSPTAQRSTVASGYPSTFQFTPTVFTVPSLIPANSANTSSKTNEPSPFPGSLAGPATSNKGGSQLFKSNTFSADSFVQAVTAASNPTAPQAVIDGKERSTRAPTPPVKPTTPVKPPSSATVAPTSSSSPPQFSLPPPIHKTFTSSFASLPPLRDTEQAVTTSPEHPFNVLLDKKVVLVQDTKDRTRKGRPDDAEEAGCGCCR